MNNQFATQFLLQEYNELFEKVKKHLLDRGAGEDSADMLATAVEKEHITFQTAIDIVRATTGIEEMSSTGGGVTNGAAFTPGAGEQYAAGTRKKYQEDVNESRAYSTFKRETATRSKPDQMHEAAKRIQNKLYEIEKLLEFTSQMRNELSEGEQTLEYKQNTKKVFERIHSKVVEVYTKVKGLK
jgi:hypothetical protein